MNGYELSRNFVDFAFENPEKIKPNHYAVYFFAIEHCNRLGWKNKFGLPTTMVMEAIGIKTYNTYTKTLTELVEWGFIKMIQKSKNQHSSNIVALSNFDKALVKALDKAFIKHASKQSEITGESNDSIDKPKTTNQKQINNILAVDSEKLNIYNDWLQYRKEIKKDIKSESTLNALVEKINSNTVAKCKEVVTNSISNGWTGLFWDKVGEKKKIEIQQKDFKF